MGGEVVSIESRLAARSEIQDLEKFLLTCVQAQMPVEHFFAKGLYARSLTIPKHCVLTGAIHKYQHINILAKGDITVATEEGVRRIQAPCVMVAEPGTKRAGFAHEECVWITVHACNALDVESAETELVTNDFQEYERFLEELKCPSLLPAPSSP
jgi:hypothetical protein